MRIYVICTAGKVHCTCRGWTVKGGAGHPASMFVFLVDPCERCQRMPVRKVKRLILFLVKQWMRQTAGSAVWGVSAFLMSPYTRQFKKVPTLALALNCSCSALEFKWPACGFQPPCLCPPLMAPRCAAVLYSLWISSLFYRLPPRFLLIRHWQETNSSCCRASHFDLICATLIYLDKPEKSGKAPKYFLFVGSRHYVICQIICPKCITAHM